MPAQSGLGFSGIVAIQIPAFGAPGEVLTKTTAANYDYDWAAGGGGGGGVVTSLTLTGLFGTILNLFQDAGVSPITIDLAPIVNLIDLQAAYDIDTSIPQITVAAGLPLTIDIPVAANDVFALRNAANTDLLRVSDTLFAITDTPLTMSQTLSPAVTNFTISDTFTTGAAFIGGVISSTGTITYNNAVFIWALLAEGKVYRADVAPGFAAFTLFNALPVIENQGNFDLVQAIVLNVGVIHRRRTAGTSSVSQTLGVSFSPQLAANIAGAVMTRTVGVTGLRVSPTFSTVAGSTVNLGTVIGMQCVAPAGGLFQPVAGVENITAYYGVDWVNNTFGGASRIISVIRSNQGSGTNIRFLDHTGDAPSRLRGHLQIDVDAFGILLGASTDVLMRWQAAGFLSFLFANTNDELQLSTPSADRFLINNSGGSVTGEYNFNCLRFSLGAQTGAVGNQLGVFVAGAHTVTVGGEFTQFLLTQSANGTINAALSLYAGWTINAPTPVIGTGSLTDAVGLNIGGNPGAASVNRVGLRIISNPSGGSGINAALWVTAGLSRFDGRVDINNGVALGGGAAPTLGTIGGAGPTAAAQAQWLEVDIGGVAHWIAVWT